MPDTNPLLQHWSLPPWSDIRAEHLLPAINVIVAENQQIIAHVIASQTEHPNWDDLVVTIDSADARLTEAVGIIDTLSTVKSDDADWLRESALSSLAAGRYIDDKTANLELYRTYQRLRRVRLPPVSMISAKPRWRRFCAVSVCPVSNCSPRNSKNLPA